MLSKKLLEELIRYHEINESEAKQINQVLHNNDGFDVKKSFQNYVKVNIADNLGKNMVDLIL